MSGTVKLTVRFTNNIQNVMLPFIGAVKASRPDIIASVRDILLIPNVFSELVVIEHDSSITSTRGDVYYKFKQSVRLRKIEEAVWNGNADYIDAERDRLRGEFTTVAASDVKGGDAGALGP